MKVKEVHADIALFPLPYYLAKRTLLILSAVFEISFNLLSSDFFVFTYSLVCQYVKERLRACALMNKEE